MLEHKNIQNYNSIVLLYNFEYTGVDYVEYYKHLIEEMGAEVEIIFANQAKTILNYTKNVLTCDIHTRNRTKRLLKKYGAEVVLGLDDVLTSSVNGSGYNEKYGLLGSNKATEDTVKLFPRDAQELVEDIQKRLYEATNKHLEVMVYGDGAFKDPQGKIWELADPVVSPFHTSGLKGTPNELKLKFLADNDFKDLKGEELKKAIENKINMISIVISNSFSGNIIFDEEGLPKTTKEKNGYHGFGTKSIKAIVDKYNGTLNIKVIDNVFYLMILISQNENNLHD